MTHPEQPPLLAALLHERFHTPGWFETPLWVDESNDDRLEQLRRLKELEAATVDYDTTGVPDQNPEVA